MNISIQKVAQSRLPATDITNPGFGAIFSDHMFMADYADGKWGDYRIIPYGPLSLEPGNSTLHYAQSVFEGLKAYRRPDGAINLFRPDRHFARFNRSCRRLCIPEIPAEFFSEALEQLLKIDYDWIPTQDGQAMYIRPFVLSNESFLGVRPANKYRFMIILSPVGAYYAEGIKPVKLFAPENYVRAVQGGVGEAKTPANYAASLLPAQEAMEKGFTQVLWLDAAEHKYVEEVGTMNIFFLIGDELITAPLEGTILGGVTRMSVIQLAKEWGIKVVERKLSIQEVFAAGADGILREVFGTGTAAVISPVGLIEHAGRRLEVPSGDTIGPLAKKYYDYLTDLHYGRREDEHNWIRVLR